ncbi:putative proline-rich receptor-like protein kinase PERK3 [Sesbania bispinosa]|nr:putative proline-rich receptor-like protein kinase PERK3 [Sesbania bispinosa]
MSQLMVSISLIGGMKMVQCMLLKTLLTLLLFCMVFMVDCGAYDKTLEAPSISPALAAVVVGDLPLPRNFHGWKHLPSRAAPIPSHLSIPFTNRRSELESPVSGFKTIAPMHSIADAIPSALANPPLSPYVSNCCTQENMVLKRGSESCHCVYPIKLDLLLLNVSLSQNPNWSVFLDELATQLGLQTTQIELINFYVLGLSTLNISMDITPHKGISFSADEASKINSSLLLHKVQLDRRFVGDYKVLNITWFKPPPPSQGKSILLNMFWYS